MPRAPPPEPPTPPPVYEDPKTNTGWQETLDDEVTNVPTGVAHVVDGRFTNWSVGWTGLHEWSGVTPAVGRFTNC